MGIRNTSGMSLIQVLIAVGVLGIAALGLSTLAQQMGLIGKNMQSQVGRSALHSVVQKVLSEKSLCDAFINTGATVNLPSSSTPATTAIQLDLKDGVGGPNTVVAGGQTLIKFDVRIPPNGFRLILPAGTTGTATVPPDPAGTLWTGLVEMELEKVSQSIGGTALPMRTLGLLTLILNGSNQILACKSFLADGGNACSTLGGTWNGSACTFPFIFQCPAGRIQVGPTTPSDCVSCPAGQALVFNGSGGFNCLPYP